MSINYDKMDELEDKVENMLEEYGAPEEVTDQIREFLINSTYLYNILEMADHVGIVN